MLFLFIEWSYNAFSCKLMIFPVLVSRYVQCQPVSRNKRVNLCSDLIGNYVPLKTQYAQISPAHAHSHHMDLFNIGSTVTMLRPRPDEVVLKVEMAVTITGSKLLDIYTHHIARPD